jgi:hypothetical protein
MAFLRTPFCTRWRARACLAPHLGLLIINRFAKINGGVVERPCDTGGRPMKAPRVLADVRANARICIDCMRETQQSQTAMKRRVLSMIVATPAPRRSAEARQTTTHVQTVATNDPVQSGAASGLHPDVRRITRAAIWFARMNFSRRRNELIRSLDSAAMILRSRSLKCGLRSRWPLGPHGIKLRPKSALVSEETSRYTNPRYTIASSRRHRKLCGRWDFAG